MEYRPLGNTGQRISRIGLGCVQASGYDYGPIDSALWTAAVRAALDDGVNFFDVADVYGFGEAERLLAGALGQRRHDVVIATKGGLRWDDAGKVRRDGSPRYIRQAVEASLRRLQLDTIPLYQLHWPDPDTPVQDTLAALLDCRREGKICSIGMSNVPTSTLREIESLGVQIDCVQELYNLLSREVEHDLLPYCATRTMAFVAHTPLARGLLAGKRLLDPDALPADTRRRSGYFSADSLPEKTKLLEGIRAISKRAGISSAAVAIGWLMADPRITSVLVGVKTTVQWKDNLQALDCKFMPEERDQLSTLAALCPAGLAGEPAHGIGNATTVAH